MVAMIKVAEAAAAVAVVEAVIVTASVTALGAMSLPKGIPRGNIGDFRANCKTDRVHIFEQKRHGRIHHEVCYK